MVTFFKIKFNYLIKIKNRSKNIIIRIFKNKIIRNNKLYNKYGNKKFFQIGIFIGIII